MIINLEIYRSLLRSPDSSTHFYFPQAARRSKEGGHLGHISNLFQIDLDLCEF